MTPNPLTQYFRHPALQVSLPSGGKFYAENTINLSTTNQYPVLPMTRQDELVFMSDLGQVTGTAVVSIIESCVPDIKDAWAMPAIDLDKLLTAIKIATHGPKFSVTAQCPACQQEEKISVDLHDAIKHISAVDYDIPEQIADLKIFFKPITYREITDITQNQFSDTEIESLLQDADLGMQAEKIDALLTRVRSLSTQVLTKNIHSVQTPAAEVRDPEHIAEWLRNCDRNIYMQLQNSIVVHREPAELKPVAVTCSNCANQYQQVYSLDLSNNE
jgi:Zn ribbon nucleic-acid-binding protein